ncbi:MAG: neutral/alkaline non-lysosomal ceramidase N-terminal domain-containing protein [Planctomycetaceae bacterium]
MKNSLLLVAVLALTCVFVQASEPVSFNAGYAEADITPPPGLPMWGYGARHAAAATDAMDVLAARAVVVQAGNAKVAIVGLDLGRGPTTAMMEQIRREIEERAGIEHVMISGSHTHHGPVIELVDEEGYGRGTFDDAVAYSNALPNILTDVILAADKAAQPAQIGVGRRDDHRLNRNRHTKREPKTVDPRLSVMRFDDLQGNLIAVVVNFSAHPTMSDLKDLRYSGDYPGHMTRKVISELNAGCVFMQGASGDLSVRPPDGIQGPQAFGELLAGHVVKLTEGIETAVPEAPSVAGRINRYRFRSRVDFQNVLIQLQYSVAFFPELIRNAVDEFADGIPAELNTVVLNSNIAMVGGSGEFFSKHALRLRERAYVDDTLFFGYCNGHSLYFPTIEGVSEGGYGADEPVSPVEVGAGEQMLNRALINIYELLGRIKALPAE